MLKSEEQHADFKRSHHNTSLIGPPALYRLKTDRNYIKTEKKGNNETEEKVKKLTYGQKDENKQNKVILMVGETGAGKTTMIDTMINYLLGVKFEDEEWYEITEETEEKQKQKQKQEQEQEQDQTQSQTTEITVYEVFVEENSTSLTIIDTPGYAHTEGYEKDREISEYLSRLFSVADGIHYIDAVCFVMKASQNRLCGKEHYIFHSVLSLFGRDIENNIVFLLTHSDGGPPTNALSAIKKAEIPCRRDGKGKPVHFEFNNRQKEERYEQYESVFRSAWEIGERSMNQFFTILEEKNRKSVQMTLDVLKERRQLEACVSNLKERITEKEKKIKELTDIQKALKQNRDKIKNCENFEFTVNRVVKTKVLIENSLLWSSNATCCNVCQENCHNWYCWQAKNPSDCWVMKNDHCTSCSGKCHHSKHIRENQKYVTMTKTVTMKFDGLKQEYECTGEKPETSFDQKIYENTKKEYEENMNESETKTIIEQTLKNELEKIQNEKSNLLHEAYITIMSLSKIALKTDSAFTLQHLDFLIPRLEEEGKDEWIKNLEDLRKTGEELKNKGALCYVKDFTGQTFNQVMSLINQKK